MSTTDFRVRISSSETFAKVRDQQTADLVHEEFHDLGDGKSLGTLIFEKYYMRTKNNAALIVLIDDLKGFTEVRLIATGTSGGMIFTFDWGAGDNFIESVADILQEYIIES
jgi:hypothetical protein